MPTQIVRFALRKDAAATWASVNPTLHNGEPALETDTKKWKTGDGVTAWNSLAYMPGSYSDAELAEFVRDTIGSALVNGSNITITVNDGSDTITIALNSAVSGLTSLGVGGAITVTGGSIQLDNSQYVRAKIAAGTQTRIVGISGADSMFCGSVDATIASFSITSNGTFWGIFSTALFRPGSDNLSNLGNASVRWKEVFAATGAINTSDRREKKQIGEIPDQWLDAWGEVEWCRYKFKKGNRWHTGLVAQQVYEAFSRHGLDAFELGLLCYDEWEGERNPLDQRKWLTKPGDRWALRYDECQAMEAAWQRREIARLTALVKREKA